MVTSWNLLFYLTEVFLLFFLLAGVSELHDSTLNEAVLTWLLFSARRVSTRSLTLNGFPTRTVILWRQRNMLKTKNTSWSQTEGLSPCPCEECRAPRWAARRSNLTGSREEVMRFLCTCITAWRCSPTLIHQTAATLLMSCGDILICSLRYSEAITGASLTHVPERQDYRIKRALRYQPTNTWNHRSTNVHTDDHSTTSAPTETHKLRSPHFKRMNSSVMLILPE